MSDSQSQEQHLKSIFNNVKAETITPGDITQIYQTTVNLENIPKPKGFSQNIISSSTDKFVGRERELERLNQKLQRHDEVVIAAVEGMGGVGKTELAIQYSLLHLQLHTYPGGICWLRSREQDIGLQIVNFARTDLDLQPPDDLELPERVRWCWKHWQEGNTLIVLDDVTNYSEIKPYLPPQPSQFKVLITTRLKLDFAGSLYLEVLSEPDALELLRQLVGSEKVRQELETAKDLCQRLGYLPLALQLVGRYVKQRGISLTEELRRLEGKGLGHSSLIIPENDPSWTLDIKRGVEAAFELSWAELNEPAQQLGCLLSLFALAPIPWSLLERAAAEQDSDELEYARVELEDLHFLQREDNYKLNQLIQDFLRNKQNNLANANEQKYNFCKAIAETAQQIPQTPTLSEIATLTPFVPHIAEAAKSDIKWLRDEDLILPFIGLGRFYQGQGAYAQALPWLKQCVSVVRERLGEEHPDMAGSLNNLAELYRLQGRYEEAEPLYLQALELRKRVLGEEHPDMAQSLNNLAQLYTFQGRYAESEPLYLQALELRKRLLGEEHPDVIASRKNLAVLYSLMGENEEREEQKNTYKLALDISQSQLFVAQRSHIQIQLQPTTTPSQDTIQISEDIPELYCFISTDSGLKVLDSEVLPIQINPQTGHPHPVTFELQAYLRGERTYTIQLFTEDPNSGQPSIFQYSDRLTVNPPTISEERLPILPAITVPVAPPFILTVETDLPDGEGEAHYLNYYLTSRLSTQQLHHQPVGTAVLSAVELARMRLLLSQTLQQASDLQPEDARDRLISLGRYFFDLFFPSDTAAAFRESFWQVSDQISSFLIVEDGITWLPWELVVPYHEDNTIPHWFWGEQFSLGRWIQGLGTTSYSEVPFSEVALTHYQSFDSEREEEWVRLLQAYNVPTIRQAVKPETPFYAMHLLRHTEQLKRRDIVPREEKTPANSVEEEIPKARLDLRLKRPLVTLSVLNGFATNTDDLMLPERVLPFLRAGASAVVGTGWQTSEAAERVFWSRFYDLLDRGLPLGEAVWRSRLAVQQALPDRPDWLAYTLFGNPRAKLYQPEDSMGYTTLECLNPDEFFRPRKPYYFRVTIRMRPPVWYTDRLIQPEEFASELTALFLAPDLEIPTSEPVSLQPAGRTMRQATVTVTAPQPGNYVLRVQLFEEEEYLKTLSMTLKVADFSGEEVVHD